MQEAPLYTELAKGPETGAAYWLTTSDGVRLRIGVWPEGASGTVLIFPGRTEYVEKYGPAAKEFHARGFASLAVDWRGQGIADRLLDNPMVGHVGKFSDYQLDVAAVVAAAEELKLPKPFYLLGHSMGGGIGLRALYEGLDVCAASFSGPMWDIHFAPLMRQAAISLGCLAKTFGQSHRYPPLTTGDNIYVLTDPFEDNKLCHDREMWDFMVDHAKARPELMIGGPSLNWVSEALAECADLATKPAPAVPAITFYGEQEQIVSKPAIEARMQGWENGKLYLYPRCQHEIMMETPDLRTEFYDRTAQFFKDHAAACEAA